MAKKKKAKRAKAKVAAQKVSVDVNVKQKVSVGAKEATKKPEANEGRKFSIIGIICAIISIVILPILFGPLAIIFGVIGMVRGDKRWGLVAVILGIVFLIASFLAGLYLLSKFPKTIA